MFDWLTGKKDEMNSQFPAEKPKSLMSSLFGSGDSGSSFSFSNLFGSKKPDVSNGIDLPSYGNGTNLAPIAMSSSPMMPSSPPTTSYGENSVQPFNGGSRRRRRGSRRRRRR